MAITLVKRLVVVSMSLALVVSQVLPATAVEKSSRSIPLVRDAEAEALIADYARPLLKVAGLGSSNVDIRIVNDERFNAFVADNRHIFVTSGAIMDTRTPNELIGILAHEIGHLAGGHLAQLREELKNARIMAIIGALGGVAAGVAGGSGQGAVAGALAGQQFAQRSVLAYQRGQEQSADSAAFTYLSKTHQSGSGMISVFERLSSQDLFASRYGDPYMRSHPMASDRLSHAESVARKSKYFNAKDDPAFVARHELVRAKFIAFVDSPQKVAKVYPKSDDSLPAAYAQAILAYRIGSPTDALAKVDGLIKRQPKNPWFHELKGQILIETGKPGASIGPYQTAVSLAPSSGYLKVMLGHAQVASGNDKYLNDAIANLRKGLADDPDAAIGYRQLGIAYARSGNIPLADLATAEGYLAAGDITSARQYAARAREALKRGTPAWLRAEDIVNQSPRRP
ncbi:TPR repeat-containing protein YfgC precursor [Hartmannibacter diazotrophicus]|uniref:TPR repeat-containing protein YfgC n=1 Tax=Hartmannibacter diazotrophicus TaxID=1482074 RepID=A0A2C9D5C1_9HYPH|nr:M48 family metalloprotease [Hartmannibacter diazotrophicus]SON55423.1 TPR repeat-containing protein YfgC precursor [Hartmannibacter diazotrophicus]